MARCSFGCCCAVLVALIAALLAALWPVLRLLHTAFTEERGWAKLLEASDSLIMAQCSLAESTSFWSAAEHYPLLETHLRPHWQTIRHEFEALERRFVSTRDDKHRSPAALAPLFRVLEPTSTTNIEAVKGDVNHAGWRTLWLRIYGTDSELGFKYLPKTASILSSLPRSVVSSLMISVMEPRVSLEPHRGDYKGVLRYHLGLQVPTDESAAVPVLRVVKKYLTTREDADQIASYSWKEGESLLFDDTFAHDVSWIGEHPERASRRVVLFADVTRPDCVWWVDFILKSLPSLPLLRSRLLPLLFSRVRVLQHNSEVMWKRIDKALREASD